MAGLNLDLAPVKAKYPGIDWAISFDDPQPGQTSAWVNIIGTLPDGSGNLCSVHENGFISALHLAGHCVGLMMDRGWYRMPEAV